MTTLFAKGWYCNAVAIRVCNSCHFCGRIRKKCITNAILLYDNLLYKRYLYDTIVYVKTDAFEHVLSTLNSFHVKFDSLTSN